MIDRYAPGHGERPALVPPAISDEPLRVCELSPLDFDRDERLTAERSAA
jgi:hypothetical protein